MLFYKIDGKEIVIHYPINGNRIYTITHDGFEIGKLYMTGLNACGDPKWESTTAEVSPFAEEIGDFINRSVY